MNLIGTGGERYGSLLIIWNYKDNVTCDCNEEKRTMNHSIEMYSNRLFEQGIIATHRVTKETI